MGAVHALYSKTAYASSLGVPPAMKDAQVSVGAIRSPEPEMQMNAYGATELMFLIQQLGVNRVHIEFTDHGGELGLFFFFRTPG
jgi:hypothetical protein